MIIYKITNKINGKVYIGKTKYTVEHRWKRHCYDAFSKYEHTKMKLQEAIIEYGAINFTVEQIDVASTKNEADEKEMYWIAYYDAIENGYNTSPGGRNGGRYAKVMIVETGEIFPSMVEAARAFGVSNQAIAQAVKNPTWVCRGFHWKKV